MLEIDFPSKILTRLPIMHTERQQYLHWTEKEKQDDPAFLPWASVLVVSRHKVPRITFQDSELHQESGRAKYENDFLCVRRYEIDFPGGEPLQEFVILIKKTRRSHPSELKITVDEEVILAVSEEELGWEALFQ